MNKRPLISVVDDDESVRESVPDLLREFGYDAEAFPSAREFLASDSIARSAAFLLDIVMPGMSGLDLFAEIQRRAIQTPVIFISAHCEPATRSRLLSMGALDCLLKPFSDTALSEALERALHTK